jgi:cysteine desulfurase
MIRAYLDNNATTRPLPEVVEAVRASMSDDYLNPSSVAAAILQPDENASGRASAALGMLLNAPPEGFVFTSGASESNSWVGSLVGYGMHVVASALEHPSIRLALEAAERRGARISWIAPDADGVIRVEAVLAALEAETRLVTIMLANNETGVLQPVGAIAEAARAIAPACLVHTDATQVVGRIPVDLSGALSQVDLLSLSAHKLHGPRGIGALFVRPDLEIEPLVHGEQAAGLRGGTHNSPGLAGLAVAAEQAARHMAAGTHHLLALRSDLERRLLSVLPGAWINGRSVERLPNTVSVTAPGVDAADLVDRLALAGVCLSTGAACSAGASEPSRSLLVMGLSYEDARSTVRLSLSRFTQRDEIDIVIAALSAIVDPRADEGTVHAGPLC